MKPERGRYQAVTQVKGLSPEKTNISEADTFHFSGRQNSMVTAEGKVITALTGSETAAWDQEDNPGTWETQDVAQKSGPRGVKL